MKEQNEHTLLFAFKESSNQKALVEALRKKSYHLLTAGTGDETINIYNDHPSISAIIISSDLPGLSAFETVDQIRKCNASIPVILLSEFITINTLRLALGIGCNEILQTPLDPKAFEEVLHKYANTF